MRKSIKNIKPGTTAGMAASFYTLLVFPGYLQEGIAMRNEAKVFCCVASIVIAALHVLWTGVSITRQLYTAKG